MSYKAKRILKMVALVMVGALLGGMLLHLTGTEIKNPFDREVNDKNLIKVEDYVKNLSEKTAKGLKIDWKDDGSFVLSGKHEDDNEANNAIYKSDYFVNVNLTAGDYVISTGNDHCDTERFGLYYVMNGTTTLVGAKNLTITVTEDTVISIGYFVKNNEYFFSLTSKITPILVADGQDVEFYK